MGKTNVSRSRISGIPRLWHFGIIIFCFYFALLAILFLITYEMHYSFLQMAPLGGAIVGPSIAAFISIYLTVYSTQARATLEQGKLTEIQITKEVRDQRSNHYKREVVRYVDDFFPIMDKNDRSARKSDPLVRLQEFDLKKLEDPSIEGYRIVKLHIEMEKVRDKQIEYSSILSINDRVKDFNALVNKFDENLNVAILEIFKGKDNIEIEEKDLQRVPRTGAILFLTNARVALKMQWQRCESGHDGNLKSAMQDFYKPIKVPDNRELVSLWTFEGSYLKWAGFVVSNGDSYRINHAVYSEMMRVFSNRDIFGEFQVLIRKQNDIEDYPIKINERAKSLSTAIDEERYSKVANCCPYSDVVLEW